MEGKDLINWSVLSAHLTKTNSKTAIRNNNIPIKYKKDTDILIRYINNWIEGKEMLSKDEYKSVLKENISVFKADLDKITLNLHNLAD